MGSSAADTGGMSIVYVGFVTGELDMDVEVEELEVEEGSDGGVVVADSEVIGRLMFVAVILSELVWLAAFAGTSGLGMVVGFESDMLGSIVICQT